MSDDLIENCQEGLRGPRWISKIILEDPWKGGQSRHDSVSEEHAAALWKDGAKAFMTVLIHKTKRLESRMVLVLSSIVVFFIYLLPAI